MKQITRTIGANESESITAVGSYVYLKAASGEFLIKTDRDESAFMTAGDFVRFDHRFDTLYLEDLSGVANNFTLVAADSGEAGKWSNVQISTPPTLGTGVDVTLTAGVATGVLAANANRIEAFVTPAAACRIGDSSVTATRGIPVAANQTIILTTTAPIYAFNAAAVTVAVAYTEQ